MLNCSLIVVRGGLNAETVLIVHTFVAHPFSCSKECRRDDGQVCQWSVEGTYWIMWRERELWNGSTTFFSMLATCIACIGCILYVFISLYPITITSAVENCNAKSRFPWVSYPWFSSHSGSQRHFYYLNFHLCHEVNILFLTQSILWECYTTLN